MNLKQSSQTINCMHKLYWLFFIQATKVNQQAEQSSDFSFSLVLWFTSITDCSRFHFKSSAVSLIKPDVHDADDTSNFLPTLYSHLGFYNWFKTVYHVFLHNCVWFCPLKRLSLSTAKLRRFSNYTSCFDKNLRPVSVLFLARSYDR